VPCHLNLLKCSHRRCCVPNRRMDWSVKKLEKIFEFCRSACSTAHLLRILVLQRKLGVFYNGSKIQIYIIFSIIINWFFAFRSWILLTLTSHSCKRFSHQTRFLNLFHESQIKLVVVSPYHSKSNTLATTVSSCDKITRLLEHSLLPKTIACSRCRGLKHHSISKSFDLLWRQKYLKFR
jgi:hypothetical protein